MALIPEILACRDRWLVSLASGESIPELARNTIVACRDAVAQLGSQLVAIGYPVCEFIRPSPAHLKSRIARVEEHTGMPLPKIMREFWQTVGGVSFVELRKYQHVTFWDGLGISGPHGFCDGVYVDSCDDDWAEYTIDDFNNYTEDGEDDTFRFTLAPDGYHKDDISGGPPYALGCESDWAPTLENFCWSGYRRPETAISDPTDFVSYLRTSILECAGFPGLLGHPGFEEIRRKLVCELRPF